MEQQNLPMVGVIICNYNYGHWIKDAINSALMQDYPAKALYIVDDASTDNSVEIVTNTYKLEFAFEGIDFQVRKRENITLIWLKNNGGPSRARNFAIKKAIEDGCQIVA